MPGAFIVGAKTFGEYVLHYFINLGWCILNFRARVYLTGSIVITLIGLSVHTYVPGYIRIVCNRVITPYFESPLNPPLLLAM